jgi:hypothetical protein
MLLAWVERIVPLCFSGNGSFYTPFRRTFRDSCNACEGKGREARTDWGPGVVLSGHLCKEPERASMTIIERSKVVDKVSNSAGHERIDCECKSDENEVTVCNEPKITQL